MTLSCACIVVLCAAGNARVTAGAYANELPFLANTEDGSLAANDDM
jgi:hypothetical protein